MKRWLFIILLLNFLLLFGQDANATIDTRTSSRESFFLESDSQFGWACLPQSETRTHQPISSVYTSSQLFRVSLLSHELHFELRASLLEQKDKILLRRHRDELGFTDIQRVFPFHQFW